MQTTNKVWGYGQTVLFSAGVIGYETTQSQLDRLEGKLKCLVLEAGLDGREGQLRDLQMIYVSDAVSKEDVVRIKRLSGSPSKVVISSSVDQVIELLEARQPKKRERVPSQNRGRIVPVSSGSFV